jgi:5-methyltetrahydrofolate--homocysteine methyltransferase
MANITLLDGAFGTEIWKLAEQHGLPKISTWRYNAEAPELVKGIHKSYIQAGSRIIYTNTFTANRPAIEKEGGDPVSVIRSGVALAREAASRSGSVRVALDFGPLFQALEPFGPVTEEECRAIYREMCEVGAACGPDLIVLETFMDAPMLAIAAEEAKKTGLPVFCTMSFHKESRTFYGCGIDDMLEALAPLSVDAVGLNCSFGPEKAVSVIREFAEKTDLPLILKPNTAELAPEQFAEAVAPALPLVSYLGSCCGSDPRFTAALAKLI